MGFLQDILSCSHKNMTPVSHGERTETCSQSFTWWIWTSVAYSLFLIYYYIITLRLLFSCKFSLLGKKAKANKITNKRPVPKGTVVFEQFSVHNGGRFI